MSNYKLLTDSQINKIKEVLGLLPSTRLNVIPVSNGWNIRVIKPSVVKTNKNITFTEVLMMAGQDRFTCIKCGANNYCHPHHIVPKSAGGQDDPDNGIFLCFVCHVGDNAIHDGKWEITDIIPKNIVDELRRRYKSQ